MNVSQKIAEELNLKLWQVENTVNLIDLGNTVPFIARYRKEVTGSLDDQVLRSLSKRKAPSSTSISTRFFFTSMGVVIK